MTVKLALLVFCLFGSQSVKSEVVDGRFFSPALGVEKAYRVYLPVSYSVDEISFPVIYLLHGWGVTERSWTESLRVQEIADLLDLQALIVMPDGDRSLYANAASAVDYQACLDEANPKANQNESRKEFCVQTPKYEDYIIIDLVSEIDSNFRTVKGREGRAVSGESAGGAGALSLALRNPEVFSSAASHSGIVALLYSGPYPFESGQGEFISELDIEEQAPEILAIYGEDITNWHRAHSVHGSHDVIQPGAQLTLVDR